MERKKIKMIVLPELEMEVLRLCIFSESFESIVSEVQAEKKASVIADAVKNLIHYKLLVAANEANSLTWVYDSDKMRESSFKATANGVEWMELNI
jgi:quinolinate synthase